MEVPDNQHWFSIVKAIQDHYSRGLKWISAGKLRFEMIDSLHAQGVDESEVIRRINDGHFDTYNCFDWLESVDAVSPEDSGQVDQKNRHGEFIDAADRRKILPQIMNLSFRSNCKPKNEWAIRREILNETVEDQMAVLFKKDRRTAAMNAPEIAAILACSEQAVRKSNNEVWKMFKAEKENNQQRLKRRHTTDSTDDIDDE